jgi:ferritin-like metal-binding protein YciE
MATEAREHLLAWLKDAHAMEQQAETMLTSQISRLKHYPDLKRKLEEHLEETRRQAQLIDDCIKQNGGDTSAVKDVMGKMTAFGQGLSGLFVDDEVIKGSLASCTFEHMEIASYEILNRGRGSLRRHHHRGDLQPDSQGGGGDGEVDRRPYAEPCAGLPAARRDARHRQALKQPPKQRCNTYVHA